MRLAFVIASLGYGGAERVMSLLVNHCAARGHEVTLITLDTDSVDAYDIDRRVVRYALGLVGNSADIVGALRSNWRRMRALRSAIRESGAEAVLSFEDRTNVLVLFATAGLNVHRVVSERTDPAHHRIGAFWELLRRVAYPLADALVVQTQRLLPWARSVMLSSRGALVIPNPLRPMSESKSGERSYTVIAVGRLDRAKGHDVLIRAFAELASEFSQWSLAIIGEGPERDSLQALAAALDVGDSVSLPGWMAAPEDALAKAAVFVMPSRYEGFPNALLEGMAAGLPVVCTACGGSDELVDNGVSGFIVPVDSVSELAAAMRRLMSDAPLRQWMGSHAAAAARRYSPAAVMPMWDAVLDGSGAKRLSTRGRWCGR